MDLTKLSNWGQFHICSYDSVPPKFFEINLTEFVHITEGNMDNLPKALEKFNKVQRKGFRFPQNRQQDDFLFDIQTILVSNYSLN